MKVSWLLLALIAVSAIAFAISTDNCTSYSSCSPCTNDYYCQWCRSTSLCYNLSYGAETCPGDDWALLPNECSGNGSVAETNCSVFTSCGTCAADMDCKWCTSNNQCFILGSGEEVCPGNTWALFPENCTGSPGTSPTPRPSSTPHATVTPAHTPTPVFTPAPTSTPKPGGKLLPCLPGFALAVLGIGIAAFKR